MQKLRKAGWTTVGLFMFGMAAACGEDTTAPHGSADGAALSALPAYSGWTAAQGIEHAAPGAHPAVNTEFLEGCPFVSRDGKMLLIASNRPGGLGGIDIWASARTSTGEPWGEPVNLGAPVNSEANDFCPTLGRDGHTLYFVSTRQAGVHGVDWCGGSDIFVTRRRDGMNFEEPQNLGCGVNSSADEFSPFPLPERETGPVLYFSSTRPGLGAGGDLYRSEWRDGTFGVPELVPGVNSIYDDGQPNLRRDGLELFFYSNRPDPGAQGGNDLYVATRASITDPWSPPANLGPSVNSASAETRPSLSWDGTTLYFGSPRPLGDGSSDIYVTTRTRLRGGGD